MFVFVIWSKIDNVQHCIFFGISMWPKWKEIYVEYPDIYLAKSVLKPLKKIYFSRKILLRTSAPERTKKENTFRRVIIFYIYIYVYIYIFLAISSLTFLADFKNNDR